MPWTFLTILLLTNSLSASILLRPRLLWRGREPHTKPSKPITVKQTPEGFSSLHQTLIATGAPPDQILVVMEATGIYWLSFATFLVRQGFAVSVVNPAQAHHFAKALLKRAKTDAIGAQTLAQLAALLQPKLWSPPPAIYEELEQRLTEASIRSCSCAVSSATSSMRFNTVQPSLPRSANAWKIWTRL